MTPSETVTRHPQFYFDNGTYIVKVENTLYKLIHTVLVNESEAFADLFHVGQVGPETVEGLIDEEPIEIPEVTVDVFDLFVELKFVCPRPPAKYSEKDLKNLLGFVHKYSCSDRMLNFVTSCIIERIYRFHPSEVIQMGINYKNRELLERGFTRLCDIPLTKIQRSHRVQMGKVAYIAFVQVRAQLDEYTRTVAMEPPLIEHAHSCYNHKGCAEDWAAVWWNGMGRLLLSVRNPQPFDDALDHFKRLQFGRVGEDCKRNMFSKVMSINIPLIHSHRFVSRMRDHVVQQLFGNTSST